MNGRVLKLFQGHVIAHGHVLIDHSLLKPFPSQIFVFKKVHRNPLRRQGRGKYSSFGRRNSGRFKRIYLLDLNGRLLRGRKSRKARLDDPRLGRPILHPLLLVTAWNILQVNYLWQIFSFIPNSKTRLRLNLLPGCLIHHLLALIFFHGCHPWKEH